MRALVLGGTGLIGPFVQLGLGPQSVTTLTRTGVPRFCETALTGDRHDPTDIAKAIRHASPDIVIDMIPFTTKGATALCDAMADTGCAAPVIALSSMDVYAGFGRIHGTEDVAFQPSPMAETDQLRLHPGPQGDAYDKTGIERIYRDRFADLTILRMPVVYGWPDCTRVASYMDPMLRGDKVITIAQDVMQFEISRGLHANAAHAVVLAARARHRGQHVYNVGEVTAVSEAEWTQKIADIVGWSGEMVAGPPRWAPGPVQHVVGDTKAIRDALGYDEIMDPTEGLRANVLFHAYQNSGRTYQKGY